MEHTAKKEEILQKFNTSEEGLSSEESKRRLRLHGPNRAHPQKHETPLKILWRQINTPIVYVLLISTLIAFLIGKKSDSGVIFAVVILNTLIGFFQEYKAHKTIKALSTLIPYNTTVVRDNDTSLIPSVEVVPGDIVILAEGNYISADLRLISSKNLECDESSLTGESFPTEKHDQPVPTETPLAERSCMAFSGTHVVSGSGVGVVVATGAQSEFGKISTLVEEVPSLETPLTYTFKKVAKWITLGVLVTSIILFIIGYLRGDTLYSALLASITLAVAAIPEGLPAIITISSSVGMRLMARRKAIIRQLPAVEALGSTSIICTDKTGTLTRNEMTVRKVWTPHEVATISGEGYSLEGKVSIDNSEIREAFKGAVLCSDASIDETSEGYLPIGDPTEIALVVAARKLGMLEDSLREEFKRKDVLPFDSETRIMISHNGSSLYLKGAPEEVLQRCDNVPLNAHEEVKTLANEGMRILAIAKKEGREKIEEEGFSLLALLAISDPPRKEVFQAIKTCRDAGITVKMITGDHASTAETISRDLDILGTGGVFTGNDLSKISKEDWKKVAENNHVFARVLPEHKLRLVQALQESNQVVAMTGDGVNDCPALKQADIGIAMGIKGTPVAKEASDMVLADDNFASIEAAVEEGRRVYDNLIKSFAFILPTSLAQALVIFLAVLFFPIHKGVLLHPMSPVQILWVNLIVAVGLSLPLAFEVGEPDIMRRPPRPKKAPLFNRFLIFKTFGVALTMAISTIGLFLWEYSRKVDMGALDSMALSEGQTIAVTTLMFFQIFYLFNCRTLRTSLLQTKFFSNCYVFYGVGLVLLAQAAFVYTPFMNRFFHSSPLSLKDCLLSLLISCIILPLGAIRRKMHKNYS